MWPQLGLAVSAPVFTARALLCAQGCSFPPSSFSTSDPGFLLADIPGLLQGFLPVLLRFLLSPETCQPSPLPFPLPSTLSGRAGTLQASPLIVFSVWQVERDETPTLRLGWLPNYFCIFSMSNYLRGGSFWRHFPAGKPPVPQEDWETTAESRGNAWNTWGR